MRFWDVQEGSVSISGTGVNQINTSNLRDMESFVTQKHACFMTVSRQIFESLNWMPHKKNWK